MKAQPPCAIVTASHSVVLRSPTFEYELDTASGLRALRWTNLLTGSGLALGRGMEISLDLDASDRRVPITGWLVATTDAGPCSSDEESGFRAGAFLVEHDERGLTGMVIPIPEGWPDSPLDCNYLWARTHVFLPADLARKPLTLVLGGFGLFDFRRMRVFLNGHELATRHVTGRWHEPGRWRIGLRDEARAWVRLGQDNIVAVQASGFYGRTPELDAVDPSRSRELGHMLGWPPQFEQYVLVGPDTTTPRLAVTRVRKLAEGARGTVQIDLASDTPDLEVAVTYEWSAREPVLRKTARIVNAGDGEVRLLDLHLGSYRTSADVTDGEQGFPVYAGGERFLCLTHPSGWAMGHQGRIELRHHPGRTMPPGGALDSMEAVLGISPAGQARAAFLRHVVSRMRRTVRGHDRPYAIFESFGSWPSGEFWGGTEADVLALVDAIGEGQRDTGCRFDLFSIELWMDRRGDGERPDLERFPNRFAAIDAKLAGLGTRLGLWTDSSWTAWTFAGNPVVHPCFNYDDGYGPGGRPAVCRATDPFRTMFTAAQRTLARDGNVRLFKFDNLTASCYNPRHPHLPGVYSTEAIQSAVIETLGEIDRAAPDAFLMLYWGHRSPWWLLHADALFESGLTMEAATPAGSPTLYARDSVTVGLDQGQAWCADVPPLGKDSLGIWLSDWGWNSSIGKERWQGGLVMDICRGSLLAQVWTDRGWLTGTERRQFADFVALVRENPKCFASPRAVGGSPWRHEPYGYCCSDGERLFLALNNCTWADVSFSLDPETAGQDLYRWHPSPAFLGPAGTSVRLRPFEVTLLEVVPRGGKPSLGRSFVPEPSRVLEPSVELPLDVTAGDGTGGEPPRRVFATECRIPATATGGIVAVTAEMRRGASAAPQPDVGGCISAAAVLDCTLVEATPILGLKTYPSPWQGWRVAAEPNAGPRTLRLTVTAAVGLEVELTWRAHFVPR